MAAVTSVLRMSPRAMARTLRVACVGVTWVLAAFVRWVLLRYCRRLALAAAAAAAARVAAVGQATGVGPANAVAGAVAGAPAPAPPPVPLPVAVAATEYDVPIAAVMPSVEPMGSLVSTTSSESARHSAAVLLTAPQLRWAY